MDDIDDFLREIESGPSLTEQIGLRTRSANNSNNNSQNKDKNNGNGNSNRNSSTQPAAEVKRDKKDKNSSSTKEAGKIRKRDEERHPSSSSVSENNNMMMMMGRKLPPRPNANSVNDAPAPAAKDKKSKKEKKEKKSKKEKKEKKDKKNKHRRSNQNDDDDDDQDEDDESDDYENSEDLLLRNSNKQQKKMKIITKKVLVKKRVKREQPQAAPAAASSANMMMMNASVIDNEAEQLAQRGEWKCLCCTFNNPVRLKNCEMCQKARSTRICHSCGKESKKLTETRCANKKCAAELPDGINSNATNQQQQQQQPAVKTEDQPKQEDIYDEVEVEEEVEEEVTDSDEDQDQDEQEDKENTNTNNKNNKNNNNNRNTLLDDEDELALLLDNDNGVKRENEQQQRLSTVRPSNKNNNKNKNQNRQQEKKKKRSSSSSASISSSSSVDSADSEWDQSETDTDDSDDEDSMFGSSSDQSSSDSSFDSDDDRKHKSKKDKKRNNNNINNALDNEAEHERAREEVEEDQAKLREFLEEMAKRCAHNDIKPADPPPSMVQKGTLKDFQLQAVAWCLGRETQSLFVLNANLEEQEEDDEQTAENNNTNNNNENKSDKDENDDDNEENGENNSNNKNKNKNTDAARNPLNMGMMMMNHNNNNDDPLANANLQMMQELTAPKDRRTNAGGRGRPPGQGNRVREDGAVRDQRAEARNALANSQGRLTRGGILGDFMGFGKTRTMIAVCETTLPSATAAQRQIRFQMDGRIHSRATLIVCPVAIIQNWINEIRSTVTGHRKILRYHGKDRSLVRARNTRYGMADHDYVLTTYHTLAYDMRRAGGNFRDCPLTTIHWHRIVLDEGHVIRNPTSKLSEVSCYLQGERRWIITATPFVNRVDDFYPLAKFLNVPNFANQQWWKENITSEIEQAYSIKNSHFQEDGAATDAALDRKADREVRKALRPLQVLLAGLMIRRTLETKHPRTGLPILVLPPRHAHEVPIDLSGTEKRLYDQVFDGAVMKIEALTKYNPASSHASGLSFNMSKGEYKRQLFACAFEMLVRCRQACSHVYLMVTSMQKKRASQKTDRVAERDQRAYQVLNESGRLSQMQTLENQRDEQQHPAGPPTVLPEEAIRIAAEQLERQNLEFLTNLGDRLKRAHEAKANAAAGAGGGNRRRRGAAAAPAAGGGANNNQLDRFVQEKIQQYVRDGKFQESCCICLEDELNNPAMPPCAHPACKECLTNAIAATRKCPICKRDCRVADLIVLEEEREKAKKDHEDEIKQKEEEAKPDIIDTLDVGPMRSWHIGSKARELLELLSSFPDDETHVLVFSQFLVFINYLRVVLSQHGHETYIYSGGLNIVQRTNVLKEFQKPMSAHARNSLQNYPVPGAFSDERQQQNNNNNNRPNNNQNNNNNNMMMMGNTNNNNNSNNNNSNNAAAALPQVKTEANLLPAPFAGTAPPSRFSLQIKKEEKQENDDDDDSLPLGEETRRQQQEQQQQNQQQANNNNNINSNVIEQLAQQFRRKKVLLATIQSCGVGLNITAATRCILLDPSWNIALEEQAISRCHRIGQQRPVHIYRFFIRDSVETHMMNLAKAKAEFAEKCLNVVGNSNNGTGAGAGGRGGGRGGIGLEDLMKIFRASDSDATTATADQQQRNSGNDNNMMMMMRVRQD